MNCTPLTRPIKNALDERTHERQELRRNRAYMAKKLRQTVKWSLIIAGTVAIADHVTRDNPEEN